MSNTELFRELAVTLDSSYLFVGFARSNDGDVSGNHGQSDLWLVKTDAMFNMKWSRCYGGSDLEWIRSTITTDSSNYFLTCSTLSNDGDITNHYGLLDIWIVKTDTSGGIVWQKSFGGGGDDILLDQITVGNRLFGVSQSFSNNYDVTGNHTGGGSDLWFTIIDNSGNLLYQNCLGGSLSEWGSMIIPLDFNRYFIAGGATSSDFDLSNNYGSEDYWALVVDSTASIVWQQSYGGSDLDRNYAATKVADGGYILVGITLSNDYDVSGNHGDEDIWVIKIDSLGSLEWQRCFGGSQPEGCSSISNTLDGGYLLAGHTWSNDGDITLNKGACDAWIIKLDSTGAIVWQKTIGGSDREEAYQAIEMGNGTIIVVGYTSSNDGDVFGNHGGGDAWVVVLDSLVSGVPEATYEGNAYTVYPNPARELFRVGGLKKNVPVQITVYDTYGKPVYEIHDVEGQNAGIRVDEWRNGVYFVSIACQGRQPVIRKLVVAHH